MLIDEAIIHRCGTEVVMYCPKCNPQPTNARLREAVRRAVDVAGGPGVSVAWREELTARILAEAEADSGGEG